MTKWEYLIETYKHWSGARLKKEHEEDLDALGLEGWELVGMAAESTVLTLVFKRPILEKEASRRRERRWPDW
jgi:hypothetical protein